MTAPLRTEAKMALSLAELFWKVMSASIDTQEVRFLNASVRFSPNVA
jgi:hypothetical protein